MPTIRIHSADGVLLDAVLKRPSGKQRAFAVLAHGITVDRDEDGTFVDLAHLLAENGIASLRFSFRGHGESGVPQNGMTISGEMLDILGITSFVRKNYSDSFSLISASFGAISSCLMIPFLGTFLDCLVLWNPILNLTETFIEPKTEWAKKNFGPSAYTYAKEHGYFYIDQEFKANLVLLEEFKYFRPYEPLLDYRESVLIIHGDQDSYVPYEVSLKIVKNLAKGKFITIAESDHGFPKKEDEEAVIKYTLDFLINNLVGN